MISNKKPGSYEEVMELSVELLTMSNLMAFDISGSQLLKEASASLSWLASKYLKNDTIEEVDSVDDDQIVDMVNQPRHYKQHAMECIDEMVEVFGVEAVEAYCRCAAWKYRYRAPYKGKFNEDNEKADWYIKKLKELHDYGRTW